VIYSFAHEDDYVITIKMGLGLSIDSDCDFTKKAANCEQILQNFYRFILKENFHDESSSESSPPFSSSGSLIATPKAYVAGLYFKYKPVTAADN